jgi:hypothetical protein
MRKGQEQTNEENNLRKEMEKGTRGGRVYDERKREVRGNDEEKKRAGGHGPFMIMKSKLSKLQGSPSPNPVRYTCALTYVSRLNPCN